MDRFEVYLTVSGSGMPVTIGWVSTLQEAKTLVERLDEDYLVWEGMGNPKLSLYDPLGFYEGCDIYARSVSTDELFIFEEDSFVRFD